VYVPVLSVPDAPEANWNDEVVTFLANTAERFAAPASYGLNITFGAIK
jgi:hypothetical protein